MDLQHVDLKAHCFRSCIFGRNLLNGTLKHSVHIPSVQILQLEKKLQDQVIVRRALEKALGDGSSSRDFTNEASLPKVASCSLHRMETYKCSFIHPGPRPPSVGPNPLLRVSFGSIFYGK